LKFKFYDLKSTWERNFI